MPLFLQPQTVDRGRDESQVNVIRVILKVIIIRTYRACNLITSPESRAFSCFFFVFAEASLWLTGFVLELKMTLQSIP